MGGAARRSSGLYHDKRSVTQSELLPLCGSEMKNLSPAFITRVKIHPCDGTARGEGKCCGNLYLANGSLPTLLEDGEGVFRS